MFVSGEEGVGNGAQLPPNKCVKKFQDKLWGTLADWV